MSTKHIYQACTFALLLAACGGGSDTPEGEVCGNGILEEGEACDGAALGDGSCMDLTQNGGNLRCNNDCTYDTTGCTLASCGNGVVEDGEACDGADVQGKSCTDIGFVSGTLGCGTDCVLDTSTCCMNTCATAGVSECVGDVLRECEQGASGCLAWQVTDCAATNEVCDPGSGSGSAGSDATCICVDRCTADEVRCEGASIATCQETAAGCLDWVETTDCSTIGTCATSASGPSCVSDASADTCADPLVLQAGPNAVAWNATNADYLTAPSCDTGLVGPDLVMSYTAPERGFVRVTMNKPTQRQTMVVSSAACGMTKPELACASGTTATISSEFPVTQGTTYYVYVRDTSTGTAPLANPLFIDVAETRCSMLGTIEPTLSPAANTNVPNRAPVLSVNLEYPIDPSMGVITITGNQGTTRTFDLSTTPEAVAFTNGGRTMIIDAGVVFPLGEIVTIAWTGLRDVSCGVEIPSPAWTFTITGPLCGPGINGMVGSTVTRLPTALTTTPTEYYVASDNNPNGYVYFGGNSDLWRLPKAGGARQDVQADAGILDEMLGYDMIAAGNDLYTIENSTTLSSNILWRLSSDGGATWNLENYAHFPQLANDEIRALGVYEGRLYMATQESTDGTEIWSVPANAPSGMLPLQPVLEATIPDEDADACSAIAVDDKYFYLACSTSERLIRIDRTTLEVGLITITINLSTVKNSVFAHDLDDDGNADVLYVGRDSEDVRYVCDPAGPGPFFVGTQASFGSATTTSNFGLSFDPVSNLLWAYDDDSKEIIKIQ